MKTKKGPSSENAASLKAGLVFVGANRDLTIHPGHTLPGKANYFLGKDPAAWRRNVETYRGITYSGIYPGIDLSYEGSSKSLKGTWTVAPGADPAAIAWRYEGVQRPKVERRGNLVLTFPGVASKAHKPDHLEEKAPVAWQETAAGHRSVRASYEVGRDGVVRFILGKHDPTKPVVIDPELGYSTYLGGSGSDQAWGIAVDSAGNAYITGRTVSLDFPTKGDASLQMRKPPPARVGVVDLNKVFVSKINSAGTALVYSTYFGGEGSETGQAIAVDAAGQVYVGGRTDSLSFPTKNGYQSVNQGPNPRSGFPACCDGFVTKIDASGADILYSSYFGGRGEEAVFGIAIDGRGGAYIVGETGSEDSDKFPLRGESSAPPAQTTYSGPSPCGSVSNGCDAFAAKFDTTKSSDSSLIYSTYIGGSGRDSAVGVAVDSAGEAYIVGRTDAQGGSFPTFPKQPCGPVCPYKTNPSGAFVTKLNHSGTGFIYSTYADGVASQAGIAVDKDGAAYFVTDTASLYKLSREGSNLDYALDLRGSGLTGLGEVALDPAGNVYVAGSAGPFTATQNDVFVAKVKAGSTDVVYAQIFGGSTTETPMGIAADPEGNAYITGYTTSTDFPSSPNPCGPPTGSPCPLQPKIGGPGTDAFVTKICETACPAITISDVARREGDSGLTPFTFNVSLTSALTNDVSVGYTVVDGPGPNPATSADHDYVPARGTLTIPAGKLAVPLTVSVVGDTIVEPDEQFTVQLTSDGAALLAKAQGIGTIINDDFAPAPRTDEEQQPASAIDRPKPAPPIQKPPPPQVPTQQVSSQQLQAGSQAQVQQKSNVLQAQLPPQAAQPQAQLQMQPQAAPAAQPNVQLVSQSQPAAMLEHQREIQAQTEAVNGVRRASSETLLASSYRAAAAALLQPGLWLVIVALACATLKTGGTRLVESRAETRGKTLTRPPSVSVQPNHRRRRA